MIDHDGNINWMWICKTCGEDKLFIDFYLHNGWPKPYDCKICVRAKTKKWVSENRDAFLLKERRLYYKHREKRLAKHASMSTRHGKLVQSAKRRAKKFGLEFKLTPSDVKPKLDLGVCEVTGVRFAERCTVAGFRNNKPIYDRSFSPSLDRIDNKKGYTKENVRVVLWAINCMCGEHGLDKAVELAKLVDAKRNPTDSFTWCPC